MTRILEALGWALVHSLWQLALVGLAAALLLRATRSLRVRYALCLGALGLCLVLPFLTFLAGLGPAGAPAAPLPPAPPAALLPPILPDPAPLPLLERLHRVLAGRVALLAGLWALGALLMAARFSGGVLLARRWRREAGDVPEAWERRFRALALRMGAGTRVALRASLRVATPVALGLVRPVVLLPPALFAGLPEAYLEALLAHELAHVVRRDYLAGLLQGAVEVLGFHHPVVWWLSGTARGLRELLADESAAAALGEPRRLALALDALDDLQPRLPSPHLPSFVPSARGGLLRTRIQRLVHPGAPAGAPWALAAVLALALPCAALVLRSQTAAAPPIPGRPEAVAVLDRIAREEGVDPQLLRALAWVESGLSYRRSALGAAGLLQVMPETARRFGAVDPADREQADRAGARYLKHLLERFDGDAARAVTAYTCGEDATEAARREARGYTALVLDLFRARAVQPASPLGHGDAEGTLRRREDGTWELAAHISASGPVVLDLVPAGPAPEGAPYAVLRTGSAPSGPGAPWTESWPVIHTRKIPDGTTVRVRFADTLRRDVVLAEVTLDAPWKTFALRRSPSPGAR